MPPKKKQLAETKEDKEILENLKESEQVQPTSNAKNCTITWKKNGTLLYGSAPDIQASKLILGFDMDDTLIKTASGAKFAKNATDWKFWDTSVPKKLQEYYEKGYKIVIFTNQAGISKGKASESDIKKKIQDISLKAQIPIQVLAACDDDQYRKPVLGMWKFFKKELNNDVVIDLAQSIYCGDAAGRKTGGHKDFSDTDYKFAQNIGVTFKTPEELFFNQKQTIPKPDFDPKVYKNKSTTLFKDGSNNPMEGASNKEMIIFCGSPASGKSTFWKNHFKTYDRINRDTLKTKEKCLKVAEESMNKGNCLVIDNTCPTVLDRKPFIDLAKKFKYDVRCFHFDIPKDLAFHLDTQREVNLGRQHLSGRVGSIPIHTWYKNFEMPKMGEGIKQVKSVNFLPGPFEKPEDEETFFCFATK